MAAAGKKRTVAAQVSVCVKQPHSRRWRAGLCFTSEPRVESVTADVLARLQADPLLIVEQLPAASASTTEQTG